MRRAAENEPEIPTHDRRTQDARSVSATDLRNIKPIARIRVSIGFPVPAFEMQARPEIAIEDAVRVELEAIAWRDGLKRK